ncbi:MAG: hypothetical protein CBC36_11895 [Verrucomicrobiaceae bacterium TMED76]|nr:MAG: hypothetical protein CBC36_11895 [Verrucomicrobiaceae bacterium TMED76]
MMVLIRRSVGGYLDLMIHLGKKELLNLVTEMVGKVRKELYFLMVIVVVVSTLLRILERNS